MKKLFYIWAAATLASIIAINTAHGQERPGGTAAGAVVNGQTGVTSLSGVLVGATSVNTSLTNGTLFDVGDNVAPPFNTSLFQVLGSSQGVGLSSDGTNLFLGFNGNVAILAANNAALSNGTSVNTETVLVSNAVPAVGWIQNAYTGGAFYGALGGRPPAFYMLIGSTMENPYDDLHTTNNGLYSLDPTTLESNGFWDLSSFTTNYTNNLNNGAFCPVTGLVYMTTQNAQLGTSVPGQCNPWQGIAAFNPTTFQFVGFLTTDQPLVTTCAITWNAANKLFYVTAQGGEGFIDVFSVDLAGHIVDVYSWNNPTEIQALLANPFPNQNPMNLWALIDGYPTARENTICQINVGGTNVGIEEMANGVTKLQAPVKILSGNTAFGQISLDADGSDLHIIGYGAGYLFLGFGENCYIDPSGNVNAPIIATGGFTGTKVCGSETLTISHGIITGVSP